MPKPTAERPTDKTAETPSLSEQNDTAIEEFRKELIDYGRDLCKRARERGVIDEDKAIANVLEIYRAVNCNC